MVTIMLNVTILFTAKIKGELYDRGRALHTGIKNLDVSMSIRKTSMSQCPFLVFNKLNMSEMEYPISDYTEIYNH